MSSCDRLYKNLKNKIQTQMPKRKTLLRKGELEEGVFEVEDIRTCVWNETKKDMFYLIKWKYYSESECTWEPTRHVGSELIQSFHNARKSEGKPVRIIADEIEDDEIEDEEIEEEEEEEEKEEETYEKEEDKEDEKINEIQEPPHKKQKTIHYRTTFTFHTNNSLAIDEQKHSQMQSISETKERQHFQPLTNLGNNRVDDIHNDVVNNIVHNTNVIGNAAQSQNLFLTHPVQSQVLRPKLSQINIHQSTRVFQSARSIVSNSNHTARKTQTDVTHSLCVQPKNLQPSNVQQNSTTTKPQSSMTTTKPQSSMTTTKPQSSITTTKPQSLITTTKPQSPSLTTTITRPLLSSSSSRATKRHLGSTNLSHIIPPKPNGPKFSLPKRAIIVRPTMTKLPKQRIRR